MSTHEVKMLRSWLIVAGVVINITLGVIGYFINQSYERVEKKLDGIEKRSRSHDDDILIMKIIMSKYWPEERSVLFNQSTRGALPQSMPQKITPEIIFVPDECVHITEHR